MGLIAPDLRSSAARIFWGGCSRSVLLMPRCRGCQRLRWYLQVACPWCWTLEADWVPVSGNGVVFTFTVVERAFNPALGDWIPFVSALIQPHESPDVRFVSRIVGCDIDDVHVGMPVSVEFRRVDDRILMPFFRPSAAGVGHDTN